MTPSRNTEIRHSVDDGVLHFTNRVSSHPNGAKTINTIGSNQSFPKSNDLNLDGNLVAPRTFINEWPPSSRNSVRLSMKQNKNSINSEHEFVNDNIVSTNNVFNV